MINEQILNIIWQCKNNSVGTNMLRKMILVVIHGFYGWGRILNIIQSCLTIADTQMCATSSWESPAVHKMFHLWYCHSIYTDMVSLLIYTSCSNLYHCQSISMISLLCYVFCDELKWSYIHFDIPRWIFHVTVSSDWCLSNIWTKYWTRWLNF